MSWVAILMGSESDWPTMQSCKEVFDELDVTSEVRVTSAHRTPKETQEYVLDAEARGCKVFICAAGMAAHLGWRRCGSNYTPGYWGPYKQWVAPRCRCVAVDGTNARRNPRCHCSHWKGWS